MTFDLFDDIPTPYDAPTPLAEGAVLLRGFALDDGDALIDAVNAVTQAAPFRHLVTPGGFTMSVAMTNCGARGWVSDRRGYRYQTVDPLSDQPWPAMPACFAALALRAAAEAGYADFRPDACLINRYEPGARLTLHQDKDETNLAAPIVSVSLGLPAVFLFGTDERAGRTTKHALRHGDVAVWGGVSRLAFHGIAPLADGSHALLGRQRINLTFRCAV